MTTDLPLVHLVDDDDAIRHSASFLLRHSGYQVVTYSGGIEFLEKIEPDDKGCVLLDVRMPDMDGLQVQSEMVQRKIALPVIILTGHGDVSMAVEAMKAGAVDFLEKPYEKKALVAAIDAALNMKDDRQKRQLQQLEAKAFIKRLSQREHDVLEGLVQGLTNKAIGDKLGISVRTVEIHRSHVMEKLEAGNLSAALKIAFLAEEDI